MARDDLELADWLDRQWDRYLQALPIESGEADDEPDRIAAIQRLHALDTSQIAGPARARVWQTVTTRLSQEEPMNGATPVPSANGHRPQMAYLYPPALQPEPIRKRRRWWPALEFGGMVAIIAILITSLATGGRYLPFRPDSGSDGGDTADLNGGAMANIPRAGDVPVEVTLRRLTFAPGARWESVPGVAVVTLVESGSLSFSSAKGDAPANILKAGSAYQSDDLSIVRNEGEEPAVALQGVVSYAAAKESPAPGVTTELLARHDTDSLAGGWTYLQLEHLALAPGEVRSIPLPANAGFTPTGFTVTLAAVESGALTISASGGEAGAGTAGDGPPDAGGAQGRAEPGVSTGGGFGATTGGSSAGTVTGTVNGGVAVGGVAAAGGEGSFDGGGQTAGVEPLAGTTGKGGDTGETEAIAGRGGDARASGGDGASIAVTDSADGSIKGDVSVTSDEVTTVTRVVPATASGVVEATGSTEIKNAGTDPAVATIFTIAPGVYDKTDQVPPVSGGSSGGG